MHEYMARYSTLAKQEFRLYFKIFLKLVKLRPLQRNYIYVTFGHPKVTI
jgi:hypothetical protein